MDKSWYVNCYRPSAVDARYNPGLSYLFGGAPPPAPLSLLSLNAFAANYAVEPRTGGWFGFFRPYDDPDPNYQQMVSLSGASHAEANGTLLLFFTYTTNWVGSGTPTAPRPTAPPYINLLLTTSLSSSASVTFTDSGWRDSLTGRKASASASVPFFGETSSAKASDGATPEVLSQTGQPVQGHHLVRATVHNGVAEVYVDGQVTVDAASPFAYNNDYDNYVPPPVIYHNTTEASASLTATVKQDTRVATLFAQGHFNTNYKGWAVDTAGNPVYLTPIPGHPEVTLRTATPLPNKPIGNTDTMPVDVGMPLWTGPKINAYGYVTLPYYGIDYSGIGIGSTSTDAQKDTWGITESLKAGGSGGYFSSASVTTYPNLHVSYTPKYFQPRIPDDPSVQPEVQPFLVTPGDSQSSDLLDLNYTYTDGAVAVSHLWLHLHNEDDNPTMFALTQDDPSSVPWVQFETDPLWQKLPVNTLSLQQPASDYQLTLSASYQVVGTGLAALSASPNVPTAVICSVLGYTWTDVPPPPPPTSTYTDDFNAFLAARTSMINGEANVFAPSFLAQQVATLDPNKPDDYQQLQTIWGACEFSVYHKTPNLYSWYVCDHYDGSGFTGQRVYPVAKPSCQYELHYQLTNQTP